MAFQTTSKNIFETSSLVKQTDVTGDNATSNKATCYKANCKKNSTLSPKRPSCAYVFFCKEMVKKVKEENKDMNAREIISEISHLWSEHMDEEAKAPYIEQAKEDNDRYKRELEIPSFYFRDRLPSYSEGPCCTNCWRDFVDNDIVCILRDKPEEIQKWQQLMQKLKVDQGLLDQDLLDHDAYMRGRSVYAYHRHCVCATTWELMMI